MTLQIRDWRNESFLGNSAEYENVKFYEMVFAHTSDSGDNWGKTSQGAWTYFRRLWQVIERWIFILDTNYLPNLFDHRTWDRSIPQARYTILWELILAAAHIRHVSCRSVNVWELKLNLNLWVSLSRRVLPKIGVEHLNVLFFRFPNCCNKCYDT